MRKKLKNVFLSILVLSVTVYFLSVFSPNVLSHYRSLNHFIFESAGWEVADQSESLAAFLSSGTIGKPVNNGTREFLPAAFSGMSFPIRSIAERESTLKLLGNSMQVAQSEHIDLVGSSGLADIYGAFLADVLASAVQDFNANGGSHSEQERDIEKWLKVLFNVQEENKDQLSTVNDAAIDSFLKSLPNSDQLLIAKQRFLEFYVIAKFFDDTVFISSTPEFDTDNEWRRKAVAVSKLVDQSDSSIVGKRKQLNSMRCKGLARPLSSEDLPIEIAIDLTSSNRFLKVAIDRPWLSQELLDSALSKDDWVAKKYFGPSGKLRLIPEHLIVEFGSKYSFSSIELDQNIILGELVEGNDCCQLVCSGGQKGRLLSVNPDSVILSNTVSGPVFSGLENEDEPIFKGIIVRKRVLEQ